MLSDTDCASHHFPMGLLNSIQVDIKDSVCDAGQPVMPACGWQSHAKAPDRASIERMMPALLKLASLLESWPFPANSGEPADDPEDQRPS
jgi:hypothetical protein